MCNCSAPDWGAAEQRLQTEHESSREAGAPGRQQADRRVVPVTSGSCSQHESYQNKTLFPISQRVQRTAESRTRLIQRPSHVLRRNWGCGGKRRATLAAFLQSSERSGQACLPSEPLRFFTRCQRERTCERGRRSGKGSLRCGTALVYRLLSQHHYESCHSRTAACCPWTSGSHHRHLGKASGSTEQE